MVLTNEATSCATIFAPAEKQFNLMAGFSEAEGSKIAMNAVKVIGKDVGVRRRKHIKDIYIMEESEITCGIGTSYPRQI